MRVKILIFEDENEKKKKTPRLTSDFLFPAASVPPARRAPHKKGIK
jgi:hypothetical protein